jgi:hypothetical protein
VAQGDERGTDEFEAEAGKRQAGVLAEFWEFLRDNRKWWLVPMLVVLLLLGILVVLAGTGVAPFIYTLF